jgi:hypothetical protein
MGWFVQDMTNTFALLENVIGAARFTFRSSTCRMARGMKTGIQARTERLVPQSF